MSFASRFASLLLLVLTFPGWAAAGGWQSRYQDGERLLAEGKLEEALSALNQALVEAGEPGKGAVLDALGRTEASLGRHRDAKRHLEASLPHWPPGSRERAVVLYNLAQVHLSLQSGSRAGELLSEALQTLPGEASIWHALGQAQLRRNDREAAENSLRKALSLADRRRRPSIASDLASMLEANRQYAKAAEIWRESIAQAEPGQARARMLANLASLQWNSNDKSQAAVQFRLALTEMEEAVGPRHPDIAWILEQYQEVLRKTGKKAEASAANERASAIRSSLSAQTADQRVSVDWRDLRR